MTPLDPNDKNRLTPQQPIQSASPQPPAAAQPPAPAQSTDDLDRLLLTRLSGSADPLTPSSGFTQSVMDAVREHATAPEPIPFPWKRFLPFAIALLCVVVAFIVALFIPGPTHQPSAQAAAHGAVSSFFRSLSPAAITGLRYIALAILLSIVTTTLSIKLAVGRR